MPCSPAMQCGPNLQELYFLHLQKHFQNLVSHCGVTRKSEVIHNSS
jgi:hypothetical protein